MGWTLPSTGMWRGEVFAISDCLGVVVIVVVADAADDATIITDDNRVSLTWLR